MKQFLCFILVILQTTAFAESNTPGIPHIQNYDHKLYGQHEQNWSIAQDNHGIMYFGNSHGLLEYDGSSWKFIPTTNPYIVRSLALTPENKIFLGGFNYFGYLSADSANIQKYVSVSNSLENGEKNFGNVWNTYVLNNDVYFQTDSALFCNRNNILSSWKTTYPFNRSFAIRDTIYLTLRKKGLVRLIEDSLQIVPGGEAFADEKIYSMIALNSHEKLIGTRNKGLFIYSKNAVRHFPTEIDDYFSKYSLTCLTLLQNNSIAVGTRENGIAIIDTQGRLIQFLNQDHGLLSDTIWNMFADKNGGLWLAMNNGIAYLELPAPLTHLHKSFGIEGTVESVVRHQGKLYIATPVGLYYFDSENSAKVSMYPSFRPYKLVSTRNSLIASGYDGSTFIVKSNRVKKISGLQSNCFRQSSIDSNRLFLGHDNGIASVYFRNGQWIEEDNIDSGLPPIRDIVETKNGDLWLGTFDATIIRLTIDYDSFALSTAEIQKFDKAQGLQLADQNHVFYYKGEALIGNGNQLMNYDVETNHFIRNEILDSLFIDPARMVTELTADQQQNLWMFTSGGDGLQCGVAREEIKESYRWDLVPFLPITGNSFYVVYPDPDFEHIIWFGGPDGLFRYDNAIEKKYNSHYSCLIRRISTTNDSVIFKGSSIIANPKNAPTLTYINNSLRFSYTATYFQNEPANRFQYLLEGFDKKWSAWGRERTATYTNIPEGRYIFRVRAKNVYNVLGETAAYAFRVQPPWHRAWWAYGLYGFFAMGIILGLIKLRSYKLEHDKRELEKIIEERTNEIKDKNIQLEEQAEKLLELDKVKSRFFTNISHEFRTPLTLIKSPVEEMLNKRFQGDPDQAHRLIKRNADRLLRLINQLLDLSKLESGSMELRTSLQPVSPFIAYILNSFSSFAVNRKIHLQYLEPEEEIEMYFDRDKMEKIMYNLISNAFKFTPENGYITMALRKLCTDEFPDGLAEISIHDSGEGIYQDNIRDIFKRFRQGNTPNKHVTEGTGIGLALTKELVELLAELRLLVLKMKVRNLQYYCLWAKPILNLKKLLKMQRLHWSRKLIRICI